MPNYSRFPIKEGQHVYKAPDARIKTILIDLKLGSPPFWGPFAQLDWAKLSQMYEANPQIGVPMYYAVDHDHLLIWPVPREDFDLLLQTDESDMS